MSNYTKSTNFATKDNLTPGDPLKVVRGTEIDTEYNNIATAIATKTDNSAAAITGGSITGITDLAIADGGTGASTATAAINNLLPVQTSAANKYLQSDGTNVSWDAVTLSTADITGTLPVANGGTGVTSSTGTGSVVLSNSPTLVTPALGTPASGVATNLTGLPISTGVSGLGTGVATFLGTPSSANLASAVSDETGSGALVFANSPTLVTPALGTPSALVGTNITGTASGLTAGNVTTNANLTGAITSSGNATSLGSFSSANLLGALTDETGTGSAVFATSPTLVTPILGTPTSATLTNATGLPIATGVSGLGTGVATFLATPSSANLAAALTDETGTGSAVFATSPTLVTPVLGTPTSATLTNATGLPLTTGVTGTLPTANGGTNLGGATPFTSGGVVYASSTSALATGSALTFDGTNLKINGALILNTAGGSNAYLATVGSGDETLRFLNSAGGELMRISSAVGSAGTVGIGYTSLTGVGNNGLAVLGNVGIGTSSPATKLHASIASATAYTTSSRGNVLTIQNTTAGGYAGIEFLTDPSAGNAGIGGINAFNTASGDSVLAFSTRGSATLAERARIDASGNLGLGVTPNAGTSGKVFQITDAGHFMASGSTVYIDANAYFDSGWKYITSAAASNYYQSSGAHIWQTAASGTAGNPISFTQAMTLDADGNLMVGTTTSPYSTSGRAVITLNDSTSVIYALQTGGTNRGYIYADSTSIDLVAESTNDIKITTAGAKFISMSTNNTERARIDSSGNLLVGTTSATQGGASVFGCFSSDLTNKHGLSIATTQTTATGQIMQFVYNGTQVGSIVNNSSLTVYNTSSDYRLKNTIAPMTGALAKVAQLKPVTYKWNVDGSDGQGFIAHELAEVCPHAVTGEKDAVNEDGSIKPQGIDVSFLVATLTAAIQEQQAIIESLKARLDAANL